MERIAVIVGKMHSGGKKNLIMEYYRNIDRSKFQFDFICDKDSNAIPHEEIEELGGKVYLVTPYENIFKNIIDIYKICKKNKYDIIHAYNGTMNIFSLFAGWCAGIKIRINESISMGHKAEKKTKIKKLLRPFSRLFSTHYMANGEACGRWQFGNSFYEKGKIQVFKTVISCDNNKFDNDLRVKTRQELGIQEELLIGHIGRLTAQKNTLFLIDIFCEILKKNPSSKFLIIGDGDLRVEMEEKINRLQIQDSVIYLGRREDIQQFYNAMDAFVLPSLYEGLPVVGVEAETCGLPTFFSTEIPKESSPCDELGHFISLNKSATYWADEILKATLKNMPCRKDYSYEVKCKGFDSRMEGSKLGIYYSELLKCC